MISEKRPNLKDHALYNDIYLKLLKRQSYDDKKQLSRARVRAEDQLQRGNNDTLLSDGVILYIDCDVVTQFYANAKIYEIAPLNELCSIETLLYKVF